VARLSARAGGNLTLGRETHARPAHGGSGRRYALTTVPFGIGPLELIIVLAIVLLIFGPKRLPGLGKSLGSGMREFKDAITGKSHDSDEAAEPAPPQLPRETAGDR
jgi:sec-independent protein translocase protein TatA